MFIALFGGGDRVGVISFSDAGYPVTGLTPAQAKVPQEKLFKAVDKISSRGAYTNLHAGLQSAREGSAGRAQYILLMSDGRMDTGNRQRDADLGDKIADTPPPAPAPEKTEEPLNLWVALGVFTVINLIIGGIAAGVVFWLRKKKIKRG